MDKSYYDKKVVYLDYMESEEKIRNGGFVKWEVRGEECRIQIHIRGLYPTDTLQGDIVLFAKGEVHKADAMQIHYGAGEYAGIWNSNTLGGTKIAYDVCEGIGIRISESRVLQAFWREKTVLPEAVANKKEPEIRQVSKETIETVKFEESEERIAPASIEIQEEESAPVTAAILEVEEKSTPGAVASSEPEEQITSAPVTFPEQKKEMMPDPPLESKEAPVPERLSADKWVQLNRIYPHIHPFGDKREYLSIGPRDFIVLSRKYQNLVQNSFLLHGYYNYGHVILTRIKEKEEEIFYLGVPGVYYDREKQAALMFGFEGFESGNERATDGGFGYYMKRVEI